MSTSPLPITNDAFHLDMGDSVTLVVGPEKHELLVHANFIARKSGCFKTALKKAWREGQIRTILMPTDDYETMTDYLRFTYTSHLPFQYGHNQLSGKDVLDWNLEIHNAYRSLSELYVLGARIMDDSVRIATITELYRWSTMRVVKPDEDSRSHTYISGPSPGPMTIDTIYHGTVEHDPARRLLVDVYMSNPQDLSGEYHPGFLLDLAQGFSMREKGRSTTLSHCEINNIGEHIGGPALKEELQKFGEIHMFAMHRPKSQALVSFKTREAYKRALTADGLQVGGDDSLLITAGPDFSNSKQLQSQPLLELECYLW